MLRFSIESTMLDDDQKRSKRQAKDTRGFKERIIQRYSWNGKHNN